MTMEGDEEESSRAWRGPEERKEESNICILYF